MTFTYATGRYAAGLVFAALAGMPGIICAQEDAVSARQSGDATAAPAGPPAGGPPASVFDDTWINIGFGLAYGPSYTGSDDYVLSPLPVVQGKVAGVAIAPRPAGLALDFIADPEEGPGLNFGPAIRLRNDRADQIEDPTVELVGELDRAVELGFNAGISIPKLLNPFDSLTFAADVRWDVAGAHGGMVIDPSITYSTPVNRGTFVSLSLGTEYVSDDFAEYYFTVTPVQSAATAGALPVFQADGGFTRVSATTLVGFDLDGNALNGGWGVVLIGGYSRLTGDAADTPYTSVAGSKDQVFVGVGLAYTF